MLQKLGDYLKKVLEKLVVLLRSNNNNMLESVVEYVEENILVTRRVNIMLMTKLILWVYDWASKLDEVFTLDVAAYDERVAEETMKQIERVIDFLPKSSNGGLYTEDDIRVATTKVIDQFKNAKVSLDADVESSNSLGMDTKCPEVESGEMYI